MHFLYLLIASKDIYLPLKVGHTVKVTEHFSKLFFYSLTLFLVPELLGFLSLGIGPSSASRSLLLRLRSSLPGRLTVNLPRTLPLPGRC